ncbi:hypothetical protein E4U57_003041 [Claviceps arundinis]|uniref:Uncharacterized protein n=1 Tax=Claviceps arundinis TaxID=1623583 RepID=A0ABQ7PKB9_9HYPO|nr:hypothetical protein E4U57_003041 [Claviceps arundinis]
MSASRISMGRKTRLSKALAATPRRRGLVISELGAVIHSTSQHQVLVHGIVGVLTLQASSSLIKYPLVPEPSASVPPNASQGSGVRKDAGPRPGAHVQMTPVVDLSPEEPPHRRILLNAPGSERQTNLRYRRQVAVDSRGPHY